MSSGHRNRLREGQVLTGILGIDPTPPGGVMSTRSAHGQGDQNTTAARTTDYGTDKTPAVDPLPGWMWDQMIAAVDRDFLGRDSFGRGPFEDQRQARRGQRTPPPFNREQNSSRVGSARSTSSSKPGGHET
jgi:hypothetical protein